MPDSIRWYLTLLAMTVAFAPAARALAGRVPGHGAFIAKPVGLLLTVWPVWFLASISPIPYSSLLLWLAILVGGAAGWGHYVYHKQIDRSWLTHLLIAELIALLAFAGFIWLRGYTPQITGTEKPMDIALFSSSARSTEMPPPDPWMAGESINYYYLGYLMHGSVSRLSGVPTSVGFNLALATTFAMTVSAAAGLGYGLARSRYRRMAGIAAGGLAAFLIAIAGNLKTPIELLRDASATWDAFWFEGPGWESSRVVVDSNDAMTINEFPSFSFILGDLHPHVMALPFTIVCLFIAFGLWLRGREDQAADPLQEYGPLALAGVAIGSLYPLNSWDFPTYLAAAVIAILLAYGWRRGALERVVVLGVASVFAWSPFWLTFVPFAGGGVESGVPILGRIGSTIGAYSGERTSAGEFLTIFGIPWAVACVLLGVELVRSRRGQVVSLPRWAAIPALLIVVVALGLPAPVLLLAGAPFAASIWLIARREAGDMEQTAIAMLCAAGFGLILLTEFVYIQDVFAGRLNTLFKVYYQVWTLLGIAAAIALVRLWRSTTVRALHGGLAAAVALVILLGVSYPIVSAHGWIDFQGPNGWTGLDGAAFVGDTDPDELAAIRWLRENAEEGDVVLEAAGCSYEENFGVPTGPLATFTGVPTIIGWDGHERQWRGGQSDLLGQIALRADEVAQLYLDPNDVELLDRYGVTLLYVGRFERDGSGGCELAGPYSSVLTEGYPGAGWTEIFASGDARLYRRTP